MPVRPQPVIYTCPACGWSKTVAPKSDALMPSEFYDACPQCGNESLESRQANGLEKVVRQIKTIFS